LSFRDLDKYQRWQLDVSATLAHVIRGLPAEERQALTSRLEEAFAPFAADGGYELPGVALCAVAC
jgi:hypothetical protein